MTPNICWYPVQAKESGLKGLRHTILGNFSTDQMVIELTKISK